MLYYVTVKSVVLVGCTGQAALERQDLPCTYLAHHELESIENNSYIVQAQLPCQAHDMV